MTPLAYLTIGAILGIAGLWLVAELAETLRRRRARRRRRWMNGNGRRH